MQTDDDDDGEDDASLPVAIRITARSVRRSSLFCFLSFFPPVRPDFSCFLCYLVDFLVASGV